MTFDFRASQIRTNKLITSGSTQTNAALLIYPFSRALDQSGSINTSMFATGSIGQDVFIFVSGAINSTNTTTQGVTVFGGDVKISGSFQIITSFESYAPISAYSALTVFGDTNFLGNATMFASGSVSGPFTASSTSRLVGATVVSGAFTSINTASFSGPVTASNTALFSGVTTFSNTTSFSGPVTASNSLVVTGRLSGSLQTLTDGTPFLLAGPNITIVTNSNGAVAISGSAGATIAMQSWIDYEQKTFATFPSQFSGDITSGVRFYTTRSGSQITGYRLVCSASTSQSLMVKVWSGSVAVASASVVITSPGTRTGSLNTSVTMEPYGDYYISYRETTGTNYYVYASSTPFHGFAGSGATKSARVHPGLNVYWFYCFGAGDATPTGAGTDTYCAPVEPVITFS